MKAKAVKIFVFLRCLLAAATLFATTAVFFVPAAARWFGFLPRLQLVPAILAGAVLEIAVLAITVLLFGRLYCSVLCPLGILQDLVSVGRRSGLFPSHAVTASARHQTVASCFRYAVLALFLLAIPFGFTGLVEPYGIFGRFLAVGIRRVGEPGVVTVCWALGLVAFILAMTFVRPRWWCNRVCPVGTFLGIFSRHALFRVRIDSGKCVKCGACAGHCKVGALSVRADGSLALDSSSCVMCGNCLSSCARGALSCSIF